MCFACVSVGKRPLLDWMERSGYLGSERSNLPMFAKPSVRQVNYWLDLALETAMLLCITEHPYMMPFLAAYYVLDTWFFNRSVTSELHSAKVEHYKEHQPEKQHCEKGGNCGGNKCADLPKDYKIDSDDESLSAQKYRKVFNLSQGFARIQNRYILTNAAWTFALLTGSLALGPVNILYPALLSLARYPLTTRMYNQQTDVTTSVYGQTAATQMKA